jgi:hypothetical protein
MDSIFYHPPVRSSGAPSEGGLCPDPPTPLPRGTPPKKGSPLPRAILAKKGEKRGPNMPKMGFLGGFLAIFGRFFPFFDKKLKTSRELCREKNAPRRRLSAGEKPANLYSTKCRFFGPPPPPGGYQCTRVPSRGSRGPSPLGPAQARSPPSLPERLLHVG